MTVWLAGFGALFAKSAVERELDDELRAHVEMVVEQKRPAAPERPS